MRQGKEASKRGAQRRQFGPPAPWHSWVAAIALPECHGRPAEQRDAAAQLPALRPEPVLGGRWQRA